MGDMSSNLGRVSDRLTDVLAGPWILAHSDIRNSTCIRLLMDFLAEHIKKRGWLLGGEAPRAASISSTAR